MVVVALAHRQLPVAHGRAGGRWSLLIGAAVFFPQLDHAFEENFGTGHFSEEVSSRYQLNDLAGRMIADHPALGVGLNNFEVVMGPTRTTGSSSSTTRCTTSTCCTWPRRASSAWWDCCSSASAMYNVALRLARSRDRLLGGVGLGVAAAMAFLMVEELLGFSLRQDVPLALYWIFAGLAVACYRMAGLRGLARPRRYRAGTGPTGGVGPGAADAGTRLGRARARRRLGAGPRHRPGDHRAREPARRHRQRSHQPGRCRSSAAAAAWPRWRRDRTERRTDVALGRAAHLFAAELRTRRPARPRPTDPAELVRGLRRCGPPCPHRSASAAATRPPAPLNAALLARPRPGPTAAPDGSRRRVPAGSGPDRPSPAGRGRFAGASPCGRGGACWCTACSSSSGRSARR